MDSENVMVRFNTPNEIKTAYSDRIPPSEWDIHKTEVALMHTKGRTKAQILEMLGTRGFLPSVKQLRGKMHAWGLEYDNWGPSRGRSMLHSHLRYQNPEITNDTQEAAVSNYICLPMRMRYGSSAPEAEPLTESTGSGSPTSAMPAPMFDGGRSAHVLLEAESDGDSVVSRKTFATHPSDRTSLRLFRDDCRRLDKIYYEEMARRWQAMADAGLLTDVQSRRSFKAIRQRIHGYICHTCNQVMKPPHRTDQRCKRCSHQRCAACPEWWPNRKRPVEKTAHEDNSDEFRTKTCDLAAEEELAENDVKTLFGVTLAGPTIEKDDSELGHEIRD
jgi:hypothetical protein